MNNKNQRIYYSDFLISVPKDEENLKIFWLGFLMYTASSVFEWNFRSFFIFFQSIQFIALILIVYSSILLIRFKITDSYLKIVFFLYCFWLFILILRGAQLFMNFTYLKNFLFDFGMLYFAPLILLFPKNLSFYKNLFKIIAISGILFVIFSVTSIKDILQSNPLDVKSSVDVLAKLSYPCGFIFLTIQYHRSRQKLIAIGVTVITLLFSAIMARRGLLFMTSEIIFFSYLLFVSSSKKRYIVFYFSILILLTGLVYVNHVYKPENSKLFGYLLDRGTEDTRTGVELYFYDDMKTKDWIIGRGLDGKYFCPNIEPDQVTNYRTVIETGYLQTILNGGLISLGLYLLICIPAIILGVFFSKNILSKASAIWIFLAIIDSYPATVNGFNFRFLLVWISVGVCYSKEIRSIREIQLRKYFAEIVP